ncbi:HAD family hydrolase [Vagococcus coleopterorum]|uniref:HAD family hydrolase n=1 Tax=Vagococcus coleopterorum TaxID=2714946 RepID=A0A6G8ANL9_9ENTE|nr:HAD family hydrolase [Vagococcus coleopterorum]QIL46525.1 HAD family hydrolase [Vagococcus coleopterorum]
MLKSAFIFDLDDTLYDQCQVFKKMYERFSDEKRLSEEVPTINSQTLKAIFIKSRHYAEQNFEKIIADPTKRFYYDSLRLRLAFLDHGFEFTVEETNRMDCLYKEEQTKLCPEPTMIELIEKLQADGHFVGVISNGYSKQQRDKIKQLNLTNYLDEEKMLISQDTQWAKPERELFDYYIDSHDLSREETYYIGDSYGNDLIGSWNADITPVWINKYDKELEHSRHNKEFYMATDYHELPEIIADIITK